MTLSRGKKCALALLGFLAVGSGMLFHRSAAPPLHAEGESHKLLTRKLPSARPAGEGAQVLQSFEERIPRLPTAVTAAESEARGHDFPAHPSRSFHPGGAMFEIADRGPTLDGPAFESPSAESPAVAPLSGEPLADRGSRSVVEPLPPVRTHVVADGDTLAKLAARYLGSADRYGEIFAANRPLLSSPDLLPIGVQLVIPPRRRPAPPSELDPADAPAIAPVGVPSAAAPQMPELDVVAAPPATRLPATDAAAADDSILAPVPKPER
ncbi:MAG TPA: tail protein X [Pirellulales bacterium]|nr:tail protein X [Pirellulales bacterium]